MYSKETRPIEGKEGFGRLESLKKSAEGMSEEVKALAVCDREGDMYEMFAKARALNGSFVIQVVWRLRQRGVSAQRE
ncbi:MAG: hypothetical protein LBG43_04580 [Treponema sp.]|nr:hypothetical protein [Treponema sp.]